MLQNIIKSNQSSAKKLSELIEEMTGGGRLSKKGGTVIV